MNAFLRYYEKDASMDARINRYHFASYLVENDEDAAVGLLVGQWEED